LSLSAWAAAFFVSATLFAHTVAFRLLMLACCAGLALVAIARERGAIRALPPIWPALALWTAWALLSLSWSMDPERTAKELRNEVGYTALAFWACYVAGQAHHAVRVVAPVVGAAAVLLCGLAFYYFPHGNQWNPPPWPGGPGNLSSTLLTLMPCALLGAWYGQRARDRLVSLASLALVVLLFAAAYTTLNRTIWVGFAAQFLLIGALLASRKVRPMPLRAKVVGTALATLIVASAALATFQIQMTRQQAIPAAALDRDSRISLWPQVLEHVKERPLTGYGFGRGMLRSSLLKEFDDTFLWHAHNLFLDTVVQVGLPGLVLLLFLLGATVREGWRLARASDRFAAACGFALLCVVAGMVMRNMTDTLWVRQNALLYWGVLGLLLAWGHTARTSASRRST
jgi:O-antigen ligase